MVTDRHIFAGSYKTTVALYGLVPLTSLLVFLFLAALPEWMWPVRNPAHPTLPRSFPSPLPEFLLSAAFWSLSHHLRAPLYTLGSLLFPRTLVTVVFNVLYVLLAQLLRLAALAALRVRHEMAYPRPTWHDGAFRTVWWLALGWGFADAATSVAQGYEQLSLYRSVMVPVERVRDILAQSRAQAQWGTGSLTRSGSGSREYMPLSPRTEPAQGGGGSGTGAGAGGAGVTAAATEAGAVANENARRRKDPMGLEEAIRLAVDEDVEQLIHLQEREELEEVYGTPVIYIPVFVPCLQRVDSFLFSMGFTLVLAWAYLLSPLAFPPGSDPAPLYSNRPLAITFPLVCAVHLFLSLLNSPLALPRIGVHTAAYVGLLVGLGGFFTSLGLWGVLS
ncbi:hypothetical protein C8Q80DRAFT_1330140 [Daedaleopsis nitida]|nr:hypothetical protein C8Q80DRAFT_1330140 [Daedaleopsis nitida]